MRGQEELEFERHSRSIGPLLLEWSEDLERWKYTIVALNEPGEARSISSAFAQALETTQQINEQLGDMIRPAESEVDREWRTVDMPVEHETLIYDEDGDVQLDRGIGEGIHEGTRL